MPEQRFGRAEPPSGEVRTTPHDMRTRRALIIVFTLAMMIGVTHEFAMVLTDRGQGGATIWDALFLLLFALLFGWIAFGFASAAMGFALLMTREFPGYVLAPDIPHPPHGRTAILMPIYNEAVDEVFARVEAMARSVADSGGAEAVDVFILSDSHAEAGAVERAAWERLASAAPLPVYYRRRDKNVARKPGNIAEWVRRFGGAYEYMLVLDADSLMSGRAITLLAAIMDAHPRIGLLQTVPTVIGATSVFQRWQQFASRLYGPVASAGLLWWSGAEASFWGHNAILRTRAFAESCGLPELKGRGPFGGHVMSHDMVEAALLRRRGWAVHMVMIEGSYEEFPPTMIDHAIRDRRWAQGNIQHIALLASRGFHWVSRLQLVLGASAYITSPMWLCMILTSLAREILSARPPMLSGSTAGIFALTFALLYASKLMATAWALADPARRAAYGGGVRLVKSVAAEVMLSVLMAPATMLTQTIDIAEILAGKPSGWAPQARAREGLSFQDVLPRYRWHLALGGIFLALTPLAPSSALWLAPVTIGLLAAPWLATGTARRARLGRAEDTPFHVPPAPTEPHIAEAARTFGPVDAFAPRVAPA